MFTHDEMQFDRTASASGTCTSEHSIMLTTDVAARHKLINR